MAVVLPLRGWADQSTYWELGAKSCGGWTADRQEHGPAEVGDVAWIDGFVTGINWYNRSQLGRQTDPQGMFGWVDNYCAAHPLDDLSYAAGALVTELTNTGN